MRPLWTLRGSALRYASEQWLGGTQVTSRTPRGNTCTGCLGRLGVFFKDNLNRPLKVPTCTMLNWAGEGHHAIPVSAAPWLPRNHKQPLQEGKEKKELSREEACAEMSFVEQKSRELSNRPAAPGHHGSCRAWGRGVGGQRVRAIHDTHLNTDGRNP